MQITIHAEIEGGDKQNVYEGNSPAEAKEFLGGLENITVLQVNMTSTNENGEARALARSAKGQDAAALTADAVAWLEEHGAPKSETSDETMTISRDDVGILDVADLK